MGILKEQCFIKWGLAQELLEVWGNSLVYINTQNWGAKKHCKQRLKTVILIEYWNHGCL